MASEERTRLALLAGLTVLALALGTWWWRSTAPWVGATPGGSADDLVRSRVDAATEKDWPEPSSRSDATVVAVDPRSGELRSDPDRSLIIQVEPDGAARPLQVSHVVWRETSRLTPGGSPLVRQANPSQGDKYRLSVGCSGDGTVTVGLSGTQSGDVERVLRCGGRLDIPLLDGNGTPMMVRFAVLRGQATLDARLEALY
ncbi:hypothetical protein O7600_16770 [Micromonospora sp. WMMA1998]|uniref:hypothetical protein n=1 Tax=Micromonospora sp. WMMA1998 TaxID=3015167 RepID=UPI00248AA6EA|nr:hypothetical protein [Micromonospora sp. WMMA1998]WBC12834.1 hypothetical protein O7600_16770 [Micromonospora sp. WMMA1998]